jgi:hypothetical protein
MGYEDTMAAPSEKKLLVFALLCGLCFGGCSGFARHPLADAASEDRAPADVGSACGNTQSDPHNCGTCGHSCLGGRCKAGKCQPLSLVEKRLYPAAIAVSKGFVYWAERGTFDITGSVRRISVDGCGDSTEECTDVLAADRWNPSALALDGSNVFWTELASGSSNAGSIWAFALAQRKLTMVAGKQKSPPHLMVLGQKVYWLTHDAVRARLFPDGTPDGVTLIANLASPQRITYRGHRMFWTNHGNDFTAGYVLAASLDGADVVSLATEQAEPDDIVAGPHYVYWSDSRRNLVMRAPADGSGTPEAFLVSLREPNDLALDGDTLFISEAGTAPEYLDGRITAIELDGSQRRVVVENETHPAAIAVDKNAIYWVNYGTPYATRYDGAVRKLAR